MELSDAQRERLRIALEDGAISVASVARVLGISRQAVHRWIDARKAARERAALETRIVMAILYPKPTKGQRLPREKAMRITSQENPNKALVLSALRSGKMDVKQAAKKAGVSERSIRAWCAIHHVRIKAERAPGKRLRVSPPAPLAS